MRRTGVPRDGSSHQPASWLCSFHVAALSAPETVPGRRAAETLGTRGSPAPKEVPLRTGFGMGSSPPPHAAPGKAEAGQERSPCLPRAGGPLEGSDSCRQALSTEAHPGSAPAWGGGPRADISGCGDPGVSPCGFHVTPTLSARVPGPLLSGHGDVSPERCTAGVGQGRAGPGCREQPQATLSCPRHPRTPWLTPLQTSQTEPLAPGAQHSPGLGSLA